MLDQPSPAELKRARRRRDTWMMTLITIGSAMVVAAVLWTAGAFRAWTG